MAVRAKMKCIAVKAACDITGKDAQAVDVWLQPVFAGADEDANKSWSKWTPSGEVKLQITNPEASSQFKVGRDYFVDFTPVE